jgi:hypothetical protein
VAGDCVLPWLFLKPVAKRVAITVPCNLVHVCHMLLPMTKEKHPQGTSNCNRNKDNIRKQHLSFPSPPHTPTNSLPPFFWTQVIYWGPLLTAGVSTHCGGRVLVTIYEINDPTVHTSQRMDLLFHPS